MKRNLIRIRNGVMPASPNSPLKIIENYENPAIMTEYGMTKRTPTEKSTTFFRTVQIEDDFAYCVFASQRIIDEIVKLPQERRHYYMDGTFKVVLYGDFSQLLIIYAEFFQKVRSFSCNKIGLLFIARFIYICKFLFVSSIILYSSFLLVFLCRQFPSSMS